MDLIASVFIFLLLLLPILCFFFTSAKPSSASSKIQLPKSFPLIGSYPSLFLNRNRRIQWTSDLIKVSPSATFILHRPFGQKTVFTANPANVQHILKTHFTNYHKGDDVSNMLRDMLGDGIFNVNGNSWKFQRQVRVCITP